MNVIPTPKRYDCSLCHKAYSRKYDLERHEEIAHPETKESEDSDDSTSGDERPPKKGRVSDEEGTDDDSESEDKDDESEAEEQKHGILPETEDPEDNQGYQDWLEQAMTETEDDRNEKYRKYIAQGLTEEEAKEKAHVKVLWAVKRIFFDRYTNFLRQNQHLDNDETHQEILLDLERKVDRGMSLDDAISRALSRHSAKLEGLFSYQPEEDEDQQEDGMEEY